MKHICPLKDIVSTIKRQITYCEKISIVVKHMSDKGQTIRKENRSVISGGLGLVLEMLDSKDALEKFGGK